MEMKDIGKRIRRKRIEKGWCQEELAEKVDLSASYIGMIERGKKYRASRPLLKSPMFWRCLLTNFSAEW